MYFQIINNLKYTLKNRWEHKNKYSLVCSKNRYTKDILIYYKLGVESVRSIFKFAYNSNNMLTI